jgi:hypothetical protein
MATLPNGRKPDLIIETADLSVGVWSPAPEFDGKPTQVHIIFDMPEVGTFVTRLKSREAVDGMIAALVEGRDQVWGAE